MGKQISMAKVKTTTAGNSVKKVNNNYSSYDKSTAHQSSSGTTHSGGGRAIDSSNENIFYDDKTTVTQNNTSPQTGNQEITCEDIEKEYRKELQQKYDEADSIIKDYKSDIAEATASTYMENQNKTDTTSTTSYGSPNGPYTPNSYGNPASTYTNPVIMNQQRQQYEQAQSRQGSSQNKGSSSTGNLKTGDDLNELKEKEAAYIAQRRAYKDLMRTAKYDVIREYSSEYNSYIHTSKIDKNGIEDVLSSASSSSNMESLYKEYCKECGETDYLDFIEYIKNNHEDLYNSKKNTIDDNLLTIIEMDTNPIGKNAEKTDNMKMYHYLYDTEGQDAADDFLKNIQSEINEYKGKKRAYEQLDRLKAGDDVWKYANVFVDNTASGVISSGEGIKNMAKALFTKDDDPVFSVNEYAIMYYMQALSGAKDENGNYISDYEGDLASRGLEITAQTGQTIGNMLPAIAISLVSKSAGATILTTAGMSAEAAASTAATVSSVASSSYLFASSGGNAYHQARMNGSEKLESLAYGTVVGGSEVLTEKFMGAMPGIGDVKVTNFSSLAKSIVKEVPEELVQTTVENAASFTILDTPLNPEQLKQDYKDTVLYTILSTGAINSTSLSVNSISSTVYNTTVQNNNVINEDGFIDLSNITAKTNNRGNNIAPITYDNKTFNVSFEQFTVSNLKKINKASKRHNIYISLDGTLSPNDVYKALNYPSNATIYKDGVAFSGDNYGVNSITSYASINNNSLNTYLDGISSIIERNYPGKSMDMLKNYIKYDNSLVIPPNVRDAVMSVDKYDIYSYLKYNQQIELYSSLDEAMQEFEKYYPNESIIRVREYLKTGNTNMITTKGYLREYICYYNLRELSSYVGLDNTYQNIKTICYEYETAGFSPELALDMIGKYINSRNIQDIDANYRYLFYSVDMQELEKSYYEIKIQYSNPMIKKVQLGYFSLIDNGVINLNKNQINKALSNITIAKDMNDWNTIFYKYNPSDENSATCGGFALSGTGQIFLPPNPSFRNIMHEANHILGSISEYKTINIDKYQITLHVNGLNEGATESFAQRHSRHLGETPSYIAYKENVDAIEAIINVGEHIGYNTDFFKAYTDENVDTYRTLFDSIMGNGKYDELSAYGQVLAYPERTFNAIEKQYNITLTEQEKRSIIDASKLNMNAMVNEFKRKAAQQRLYY